MKGFLVKKVSVILPNYNYAKYLKKRIDSILKQTYPIYELIILDDCSTDGSVQIIENEIERIKILKPEFNVSFVKNEQNSGKAMAQWKKGVEMAKGDFIWIAEADDLAKKTFLEETMQAFEDEDVMLSYCESEIINSIGITLAPNFRWSRDKERTGHYDRSYIKDGITEIKEIMAIRCTIPNVSSVVFRKNKEFLNHLDEALKFTQVGDWYFYVKILESGKIAYNRKALNKFRIHRGSATNRGSDHLKEIVEMHNYFKEKYDLSDIVIAAMNAEQARAKMRLLEK